MREGGDAQASVKGARQARRRAEQSAQADAAGPALADGAFAQPVSPVHLPSAHLNLEVDDLGIRVQFCYPDANLGDWNGVIGLFAVADVTLGAPLANLKRCAFRKVLANRPTGAVTFSTRVTSRVQDGVYTCVLFLDSLHEQLGWRCLAKTHLVLGQAANSVRDVDKAIATTQPHDAREMDDELGHQLDEWLESTCALQAELVV